MDVTDLSLLQPWALSVQKDGTKQPCPVQAISSEKPGLAHDPIFSSSLRGGCVEKEQDGLGTSTVRLHQRRDALLAAEKDADHALMKHSFTDRYLRANDGRAMKHVMAGDGKLHLKPSQPEKKVENAARPAAGQGVQVGVGGDDPPYSLQVARASGRSLSASQLLAHKSPDRGRVTDSVRSVLQSEGVESDGDVDAIRQELGRKRSVSIRSSSVDLPAGGDITHGRFSKRFNIENRTTHHFTDDAISQDGSEAGSHVFPTTQQKRVRNPGAFNKGYSEFTVSQHNKDEISRFESETPQRLRRAASQPPERFATDVVSHVNAEQIPPASASRPNTARQKNNRHLACSPGGVDMSLRQDTPKEIARASELRQHEDAEFAKKCVETRRASVEATSQAKSTVRRIDRRASASVGNLLRWD
jgi:hypothetical protein